VSTIASTRPTAPSQPRPPGAPNRWRRRALRVLAGLLAMIITAAVTATTLDAVDVRRFPAPGDLVTLPDGRVLHLDVRGERSGGPTIVLEAGFGSFSPSYAWMHAELATTATTVAYDRPGYGWSDPVDGPVDPIATADDLRAALVARGLPEPYVLVGHSLGAHYVRIFAARYPDAVVGLVLLDPSHEDQFDRVPDPAGELRRMNATLDRVAILARFGVLRLRDPHAATLAELPRDVAAQLRALTVSARFARSMATEGAAVVDIAAAVPRALGDLPVRVVSATEAEPGEEETRAISTELHRELASRSSLATHHEIAGAAHVSLVTDRAYALTAAGIVNDLVVSAVEAR
jgi:pimeloyl-ACP methyl ester carboxylesterase